MVAATEERQVAINARNVPADLRNRFKSFCADREVNMNDAVVALMRFALDRTPCLEIGLKRDQNS